MTHTHQTAPTQFVEANGIRFAYRRFGKVRERRAGRQLQEVKHVRTDTCNDEDDQDAGT